jgi:hypothetical protein
MSLHMILWSLRRSLGLSPTQQIFRELAQRGVRLNELHALELFAHSGFLHTKDYLPQVASLEAWEIDPRYEKPLRHNLPRAEVKITDSYREIRRTPRKYSLIVVDAPDCVHGDTKQYCEHFGILPEVFRVAQDSTVLILNVMPGCSNGKPPRRSWFTAAHLEQRRRFYGTDHPEKLSVEAMVRVYRKGIEANGFELEWFFSRPRTRDGRLHYLALKINRRRARTLEERVTTFTNVGSLDTPR